MRPQCCLPGNARPLLRVRTRDAFRYEYIKNVSMKTMHHFTIFQLVNFAILFALTRIDSVSAASRLNPTEGNPSRLLSVCCHKLCPGRVAL